MVDLLLELAGWVLLIVVSWTAMGLIGTGWYWWSYGRDKKREEPKRGY